MSIRGQNQIGAKFLITNNQCYSQSWLMQVFKQVHQSAAINVAEKFLIICQLLPIACLSSKGAVEVEVVLIWWESGMNKEARITWESRCCDGGKDPKIQLFGVICPQSEGSERGFFYWFADKVVEKFENKNRPARQQNIDFHKISRLRSQRSFVAPPRAQCRCQCASTSI